VNAAGSVAVWVSGFVTTTLPVVGTVAGRGPVVAVICVGVTAVTFAGMVARTTCKPGWKFVPMSVTVRPPMTFAQSGETAESVGAGHVSEETLTDVMPPP
jgi:hypothetical protein